MTGKELIRWICKNKAEDLECVIQYQDGGGIYPAGEILECPALATFKRNPDGRPYDVDITHTYTSTPNCIVF